MPARVLASSDMEALRLLRTPGVGFELEARDCGRVVAASQSKSGTAATEVGLKIGETCRLPMA